MPERSLLGNLRVRIGRAVMDTAWTGIAQAGHLPAARPARHGVERISDVAYTASGLPEHTLDVYRPLKNAEGRPRPVVLYLHGGGFRILSKDTHWLMSLAFARRGYVVFTINYRLAPEHPFPAAIEDSGAALLWVAKNAARFGGDPERIVLAGESAGANLATTLAIATSYERPEAWACDLFAANVRPKAVLPACGMLQASDVARYLPPAYGLRPGKRAAFVQDRLQEVEDSYLPTASRSHPSIDLADPLVVLEHAGPPTRPLPPFFAGVGTRDILQHDTRRLKDALDTLGVPCEARYYDGGVHAFHALVWNDNAKAFWRDTFAFLKKHVPAPTSDDAATAAR